MNPVLVLNEGKENISTHEVAQADCRMHDFHTVLIATIDQDIRTALADLMENAEIKAIWVSSVKDVKTLISKQQISACFCGLWLQDGTYREIIRHLRRERIDVPTIIVSAPTCPQEFRDYLAAMNLGALDVLSYPYEQSDFERMIESAISSRSTSDRHQTMQEASPMEVQGAA